MTALAPQAMLPALQRLRQFLHLAVLPAYDAACAGALPGAVPWPAILAAITDGQDLMLSRRWRFSDRRMLPVLLEEILCHHDYYAETAMAEPRILDCGANFGLATYYFTRSHPTARIEAFEPNPALADVLALNLQRNNFANVTLHRVAVSDRDGRMPFHVSQKEDAASSLLAGRPPDDAVPVMVDTVDIRGLLTRPVSLLKMDIEGVEAEVLAHAGPLLRQCETIICETHAVDGRNTLLSVLNTLDVAGFGWAVARSLWDEGQDRFRLARTVDKARSYCVFARRKGDQPEAGAVPGLPDKRGYQR